MSDQRSSSGTSGLRQQIEASIRRHVAVHEGRGQVVGIGFAAIEIEALFNGAAQAERMARLLKEARQYIADATHDEDPETQRLSWALLVEIDTTLALSSTNSGDAA